MSIDELFDDDFYDDEIYDEDDFEEKEEEREAEIADACTCGAWGFTDSGHVYHIADCICGAE